MPLLYHYSPLLHLEAILREGLRLGEIAGDPDPSAQAVSLTTQADPVGMHLWGQEIPFETAFRPRPPAHDHGSWSARPAVTRADSRRRRSGRPRCRRAHSPLATG
jgi:hypothetical protein